MKQPRIVIIGHACIDTNISEHTTYEGWGSSVLYISRYYQRYEQLDPIIITSYGADLLKYLPQVRLLPGAPNRSKTLQYENDSSSGKRTQRCFNATESAPPDLTPAMRTALQGADIVIVATLLPNYTAEYVAAALALVPARSLKVLCPQGYFRAVGGDGAVTPIDFGEAPAIIPLVDVVIYSEEDHPQAFARAQAWAEMADTSVVVTQGDHGASLMRKGVSVVTVPTTPIAPEDIIDSVGCGDTFAATLALTYYRVGDMASAIEAANSTAGAKLKAAIPIRE
ncbi:MAG TPA: PfkB family carbohydrate kinase [Candidatus Saccharimonadales bacterium]|nr:PfkB family carbohydrate kinase [Candidatus Saccharimonadales bacterium]